MSSNRSPSLTLIADTVRSHRRAIVLWVLASAVAMYASAVAIASEADRFEGGLPEMARGVEAGAEALRVLRWPAERLDTTGGYLTYHNLTLFSFFLALYAGTQGVGAIRGAEPRHVADVVLATGRSRGEMVRDRAIGFGVVLALISVGTGAGLALSMAAAGASDVAGSFLIAVAAGASALVAFGLGIFLSQLVGTARGANGLTALVLTVLYLLTNVADEIGPLGVARFVSPFHYFNQSRALVPGRGFSIPATALSLLAAAVLIVAAARAFERRDVDAPLFVRPPRPSTRAGQVQRPALRRLWTATILRERIGLVVWTVSAGAGLALVATLEPSVADVWDKLGMTNVFGDDRGLSVTTQYLGFASEIITPIVAAFVITQAAGWVADLEEGRVEIILAAPMSWSKLVWQRLTALMAGAAAIVAGGLIGLALGAAAVGAEIDAAGLARLAGGTLLFAAAFGAVAALIVAWLRTNLAVTVLAIFTGASYLLVLLVPLFAWPDWVTRMSIFGAFGHPYVEIPASLGIAFLAVLAVLGGSLAATIAERSPKTV